MARFEKGDGTPRAPVQIRLDLYRRVQAIARAYAEPGNPGSATPFINALLQEAVDQYWNRECEIRYRELHTGKPGAEVFPLGLPENPGELGTRFSKNPGIVADMLDRELQVAPEGLDFRPVDRIPTKKGQK